MFIYSGKNCIKITEFYEILRGPEDILKPHGNDMPLREPPLYIWVANKKGEKALSHYTSPFALLDQIICDLVYMIVQCMYVS